VQPGVLPSDPVTPGQPPTQSSSTVGALVALASTAH